MCMSCGCGDYEHRHPGSHSIVWSDLQDAAEDAGISPKACAWNIVRGTNAMSEPDEAEKGADVLVAADGIILKAEDERRFLLTVVYSPHRMPLRGADKRTDLATPEVLEKACWVYTLKGLGTGMWHEDGHREDAVCVENYVYRGPDWSLKDTEGNTQVVKAGDWLAGFILSPRAWNLFKSGRVRGVSMQGAAGRKRASAEALALVGGRAA